jgi:peptidoglycan L-alanyl-D-glutamate endopeptidase CwlK
MPKFGSTSKRRLSTCEKDLQLLFKEVVRGFDCTIVCGHRGEEAQNEAYKRGNSKVKYPHGRHNANPSRAVDVAPYPIDWTDRDRFHYFAGYVKGIASQMGIDVIWGGDWDNDTDLKDNGFDDLVHFELKK